MTHRDARPDSSTLGQTLRDEYARQARPDTGEVKGRHSRRHGHGHHHHHHQQQQPPRLDHDNNNDHHRPHRPRPRPHHARPPAVVQGPDASNKPPTRTSKQELMAYLNRPLPPPPPARTTAYSQPRPPPPRPAAPPHHPWEATTPFENPRAAPPTPGRPGRAFSVGPKAGKEEPRRGRPRELRHRSPPTRTKPRSATVSPGLGSHWSDDSSDLEEQKHPHQHPQQGRGGGDRTVRGAVRRASESMVGAVRRVGSFASRASSRSRSRQGSLTSSSSAGGSHHHHQPRRGSSANDRTRNLLAAVRDRIHGGAR